MTNYSLYDEHGNRVACSQQLFLWQAQEWAQREANERKQSLWMMDDSVPATDELEGEEFSPVRA